MGASTEQRNGQRRRPLLIGILILFSILLCIMLSIVICPLLLPLLPGGPGTPTAEPPNGLVAVPGGPYVVDEGSELTLDGSGSTGTIDTYTWDFGDGTTGSGVSPMHTYTDGPAAFTVELTVSNGSGGSNSATVLVTVNNVAPTALPGGPYMGNLGETVVLSGTCQDPSPEDEATCTLAWTDENSNALADAQFVCPAEDGTFTVNLTVTDKDGASSSASTTVTCGTGDPMPNPTDTPESEPEATATPEPEPEATATPEPEPEATATPEPEPEPTATAEPEPEPGDGSPTAHISVYLRSKNGLIYGFDASGSSDSDGQIVTYEWDFGDGNTGTGVDVLHTYEADGSYTVTLTVTDNDGKAGVATATVP